MNERLTPDLLAEIKALYDEISSQNNVAALMRMADLVPILVDEIERLQRIEQAAKRVTTMHRYDHRRVAGLCGCSLCALHVALDSEKGGAGE